MHLRNCEPLSQVRREHILSAAIFAATAGLLFAYAIDAGAYDLVARQRFGIVVWWSLFLIVALGLRPLRRPALPAVLILLALGGLTAWAAVSLAWSQSDERTLVEVARTLHHLGLFALVLVVAGRRRWLAVVGGATLAAVMISGVALGGRLAPNLFGEDITAGAFSINRLSYPLGYWNGMGAWSAMTAGLLLSWSAHARLTWVRCAALAAIPPVLAVLYLTYSRAALIELAVAMVVVVAFAGRRWLTAAHVIVALGLGAAVVAVIRDKPEIAELTGTTGRGSVLLVLAASTVVASMLVLAAGATGLGKFRLSTTTARRSLLVGGAVGRHCFWVREQ